MSEDLRECLIEERPALDIAVLRLNRPSRQNALNRALLGYLEQRLEYWSGQRLRALILTGTGKSFCAGADLRELGVGSPLETREFAHLGHRVLTRIEQFPCPVLAAVNGYALGGGCELACACDLRYASEEAKLGQTECRVGMITGWGATFRLPRLVGAARAKELVFTGRLVSAQEACRIGLVNQVFPADGFLDQVLAVAGEIARSAPLSVQLSKQLLNRYPQDAADLVTEESLALAFCVTTADQKEGLNAFLEKRRPMFQGK
jgi:enoyl-CoA hydratase